MSGVLFTIIILEVRRLAVNAAVVLRLAVALELVRSSRGSGPGRGTAVGAPPVVMVVDGVIPGLATRLALIVGVSLLALSPAG
ncbi:MAG: hypothetical protein M3065_04720 [Actinomycetota bacterium]|nr:hypothetical protein [Actinomycetota bacterium]